jgi:hypothetical protein
VAGTQLTLAQLEAKISSLETSLDEMVVLPDSAKIGPDSYSGMGNAYARSRQRLEELCAERDALINNAGCPRPSRMEV